MTERMVRLLYVGLKEDVGFDSADYHRLVGQIEELEGVRHCRELKSVGFKDMFDRMVFLAQARERMAEAFDQGVPSYGTYKDHALRVIDKMGEELTKKMQGLP